jgi:hypothetical protein
MAAAAVAESEVVVAGALAVAGAVALAVAGAVVRAGACAGAMAAAAPMADSEASAATVAVAPIPGADAGTLRVAGAVLVIAAILALHRPPAWGPWRRLARSLGGQGGAGCPGRPRRPETDGGTPLGFPLLASRLLGGLCHPGPAGRTLAGRTPAGRPLLGGPGWLRPGGHAGAHFRPRPPCGSRRHARCLAPEPGAA